ncbi:unnamed protein product [Cuscuta campestris]|uniref:Uncharacterized protein n=1 Tax=Cuscuta campestris TaxID=132261 RepID=A0A484KFQ8_9ASTE|nr:unnamed protein product [Cuscuta campestris]
MDLTHLTRNFRVGLSLNFVPKGKGAETEAFSFVPQQNAGQPNVLLNAGDNQNFGNSPENAMPAFMAQFLQQRANASMFQQVAGVLNDLNVLVVDHPKLASQLLRKGAKSWSEDLSLFRFVFSCVSTARIPLVVPPTRDSRRRRAARKPLSPTVVASLSPSRNRPAVHQGVAAASSPSPNPVSILQIRVDDQTAS